MIVCLRRLLMRKKWLTFILMGLFFFLFGISSLNLFSLFKANFNLFFDNGFWMVVNDGGLQQFLELLFYAVLSMVFYILFKCCEYTLVHWVTGPDDASH